MEIKGKEQIAIDNLKNFIYSKDDLNEIKEDSELQMDYLKNLYILQRFIEIATKDN